MDRADLRRLQGLGFLDLRVGERPSGPQWIRGIVRSLTFNRELDDDLFLELGLRVCWLRRRRRALRTRRERARLALGAAERRFWRAASADRRRAPASLLEAGRRGREVAWVEQHVLGELVLAAGRHGNGWRYARLRELDEAGVGTVHPTTELRQERRL